MRPRPERVLPQAVHRQALRHLRLAIVAGAANGSFEIRVRELF
jgi:hypothetical protein